MNKLFQQLQMPMTNQQAALSQKSLPSLKNNLNLIQGLLKNSNDPSSFIQNIIMNNPKMKNVMNTFQSSGMTPKEFFYQYAQKQGVDPDQFLNS